MNTQLTLTDGTEITICIDEFQEFIFVLDKYTTPNDAGRIGIWVSEKDITNINEILSKLR